MTIHDEIAADFSEILQDFGKVIFYQGQPTLALISEPMLSGELMLGGEVDEVRFNAKVLRTSIPDIPHSGQIVRYPNDRLCNEFQQLIDEEKQLQNKLQSLRDEPAVTTDGTAIRMLNNSGLLADLTPGLKYGAQGIGLYRTEIPFMVRQSFPSEQEQVDVYNQVFRIYTGKPARLLKTRWTEAWSEDGAPEPLPMPLQNLLVAEAHNRINASGDPDVISMPVGQIVGRMNDVRPVAEVMASLIAEYEETVARLGSI